MQHVLQMQHMQQIHATDEMLNHSRQTNAHTCSKCDVCIPALALLPVSQAVLRQYMPQQVKLQVKQQVKQPSDIRPNLRAAALFAADMLYLLLYLLRISDLPAF